MQIETRLFPIASVLSMCTASFSYKFLYSALSSVAPLAFPQTSCRARFYSRVNYPRQNKPKHDKTKGIMKNAFNYFAVSRKNTRETDSRLARSSGRESQVAQRKRRKKKRRYTRVRIFCENTTIDSLPGGCGGRTREENNRLFLSLFSDSGDLLRAEPARGHIRAKGEVALTIASPHGSVASHLRRC